MRKLHNLAAPLLPAALGMLTATSLAQLAPMPLPKVGSCPLGYYRSGSYCVPADRGTKREAIQKSGSIPLCWYSSVNYCVRNR